MYAVVQNTNAKHVTYGSHTNPLGIVTYVCEGVKRDIIVSTGRLPRFRPLQSVTIVAKLDYKKTSRSNTGNVQEE